MPARPLHALWAAADCPPLEWFIGATDVVHGTNFLVPPTGRAAAVVSVHDLTPLHHPELCDEATLAYPGLIRRALAPRRRGSTPIPPSWPVRSWRRSTPIRPASGSSTPAFPTCPSRPRRRPPRCCGGSCPPASSVLPGHRDGRAPEGPAGPGAGLRRGGRRASPTSPSSWPARRAGASRPSRRPSPRRRPGAGSSAPAGWTQPELAVLLARASVLAYPLPLRGIRLPAAAGHAGRRAGGGDPGRLVARGARRRRRCWSTPAITTALAEALTTLPERRGGAAPPHCRGRGMVGPLLMGALW